MARLEDLAAGASVRGLTPEGLTTIQSVQWHGDQAVEGREATATSVTLTKIEILCARNKLEFRQGSVLVDRDGPRVPVYVCDYDFGQPGIAQTSATFPLSALVAHEERKG